MRPTSYDNFISTIVLCFLINGIISAIPPKSVNLALETSFLIEPQDLKQNFSGINNLQSFLEKIQNHLNPNGDRPVFRSRKNFQNTITNFDLEEFVQELGVLLLNYEEEDIKKLVLDLKDIVDWRSKDPKFNEIFTNDKQRTMIINKTNELAVADPLRIKVNISKYIIMRENETTPFSNFIRRLNKLLRYPPNLKTLLNSFKDAQVSRMFTKPIENSVGYLFYQWDKMDKISRIKVGELLSELFGEDAKYYLKPKRRNYRSFNNDTMDSSVSFQDNAFSDNSINIETVLELNKNVQFSVSSNFNDGGTKDGGKKKLRKIERRSADKVTFLHYR